MKTSLIIKRTLFYCLSFTWGIIMSLIGLITVTSIGLFKGFHIYHGRLFTSIGKNWGGVSFGCFFICSEDCINSEHLKAHECGHGLQNIVFGPLFPFVVAIPSMIRYWYRELKYSRKNGKNLNPVKKLKECFYGRRIQRKKKATRRLKAVGTQIRRGQSRRKAVHHERTTRKLHIRRRIPRYARKRAARRTIKNGAGQSAGLRHLPQISSREPCKILQRNVHKAGLWNQSVLQFRFRRRLRWGITVRAIIKKTIFYTE